MSAETVTPLAMAACSVSRGEAYARLPIEDLIDKAERAAEWAQTADGIDKPIALAYARGLQSILLSVL